MQKISWGIKSLLEKTHAQYIITTIIHLFEINREDGLLSLACLLKASFIFPLGQAETRQPHRELERNTLMCLLCFCLPAQKSTKSWYQCTVCAGLGPSGMQWGKVSREAGSSSICIPTQPPSYCSSLSKAAGPLLSWKRSWPVCFESGCVISLLCHWDFPWLSLRVSLLPGCGTPAGVQGCALGSDCTPSMRFC